MAAQEVRLWAWVQWLHIKTAVWILWVKVVNKVRLYLFRLPLFSLLVMLLRWNERYQGRSIKRLLSADCREYADKVAAKTKFEIVDRPDGKVVIRPSEERIKWTYYILGCRSTYDGQAQE